ncbi:uncharacterized protein TRAVEDRAFT_26238 [Trametes versicolor FP-101664 SS1]|uniref:uncharacterized protein n=1 Tax=Trametes versicolor (strain FP-101664) TaxID=717944 RepID=UPI0004621C0A|nr:uncharacterized protein TRAVEDRAFT_26238 [Trametes versicolor FP-101664 SS1]EIW62511.1 hypothetical protein TRAVEDRAFT_26238 [Trametes versicolor FP-101664 SS1]
MRDFTRARMCPEFSATYSSRQGIRTAQRSGKPTEAPQRAVPGLRRVRLLGNLQRAPVPADAARPSISAHPVHQELPREPEVLSVFRASLLSDCLPHST